MGEQGPDWAELPIADLHGSELEWSTVMIETRKMKKNVCLFCKHSYTGGPYKVRQHLDKALKNREVCALRCRLSVLQVRACAPGEAYMERHGDIVDALRKRAELASIDDDVLRQRAQNRSKSYLDSSASPCTGSITSAPVFMRPSASQVDEQWTRAICKKGLAIDLVDDPEFRKAVLMTARSGLGYVDAHKSESMLPHRTKMSTSHIPALDEKIHALMKKKIYGLIQETGVCFVQLLT
jgi:hypothetical protein